VLKLHNAADSHDLSLFDAQNALMARAAAAGVRTSTALAGADGALVQLVTLQGRRHALRALSWLPGDVMGDAPQVRTLIFFGALCVVRVHASSRPSASLKRPNN
jgi:Ser/Thr protein kinase RdoA (MazF antagonist)